jgi:hypothetical protein
MTNTQRKEAIREAVRIGSGGSSPSGVQGRSPASVQIEPGQWVLAYVEHFYPGYIDGDMAGALERLVHGGSGWDCLRDASDQFEVLFVEKVMPKTFISKSQQRRHRYLVVASGSHGEMQALRTKLFTIGFAADRAIEEETARLVSELAARTRADALAKVHAALPHIFGRAA